MSKRRDGRGSARGRAPATETPRQPTPRSVRGPVIFALIVVACLTVAAGYVVFAVVRSPLRGAAAPTTRVTHAAATASIAPASHESEPTASFAAAAKTIMFQNVERDNGYAQVAAVPAKDPGGERTLSGLSCERVHFAAYRGLCLVPEYGLIAKYYAVVFDSDFAQLARIPLDGAPTRARV